MRVTAMGATSRILIELMTFGMWRADQNTRLTAQLKPQSPTFAGAERLQTSVQRQRALQGFGAAAGRQAKSNGVAGQGDHRHMRYERQRFEVGLNVCVLAKIADAGNLHVDRHEIAAGGEQTRIQIRRAVDPLQYPGVFAAAVLKQVNPAYVGGLAGTARPADQSPFA